MTDPRRAGSACRSARQRPAGTQSLPYGKSAARYSAAVLPPALLIVLVYLWGVDVPYWDQWAVAPLVGDMFEDRLGFGELWRQHNDHRIFFPRLVMLGLARLSGWNVRWELMANVAFAMALFLVVARWLREEAGPRPRGFTVVALSLFVFNLSQWENWAWGLQLVVLVNAAAVAGGLRLLARDARSAAHLAGAAALGVVATNSFANGLLFWPLSLPLVLLPEGGRLRRGAAWGLLTAAVVALFFFDYTFAGEAMWRPASVRDLLDLGAFVCVYLGAPVFAYDGKLAFLGGALACVVFTGMVLRLARGPRPALVSAAPWIALAAYAVGSGALAAFGRLELGLPMAMSSRYILVSDFFWFGLLGVACVSRRVSSPAVESGWRRELERGAAALVAISLIAGSVWGGVLYRRQHLDRTRAASALLEGRLDENQPLLYPDNRIPPEHVEVLRRHRLSLFRPALNGPSGERTSR